MRWPFTHVPDVVVVLLLCAVPSHSTCHPPSLNSLPVCYYILLLVLFYPSQCVKNSLIPSEAIYDKRSGDLRRPTTLTFPHYTHFILPWWQGLRTPVCWGVVETLPFPSWISRLRLLPDRPRWQKENYYYHSHYCIHPGLIAVVMGLFYLPQMPDDI